MLVERWRMLLADESGFTLPELLTSMAILLTIMTGFTGLLVSTSRAEIDMNNRFQARTEAHLALSKMRREVHCAISGVTARRPTPARATLTLDAACPTAGAGTIDQLVHRPERDRPLRPLALRRRRLQGGTGVKVADYLSAGTRRLRYYPQSTCESRQARRATSTST